MPRSQEGRLKFLLSLLTRPFPKEEWLARPVGLGKQTEDGGLKHPHWLFFFFLLFFFSACLSLTSVLSTLACVLTREEERKVCGQTEGKILVNP